MQFIHQTWCALRTRFLGFRLIVVALLSLPFAHAQISSAAVNGSVRDQQSAAIPAATSLQNSRFGAILNTVAPALGWR